MFEPLALPPGLSAKAFNIFLDKVLSVVGAGNVDVITTKEQLDPGSYMNPQYSVDPHPVLAPDTFLASAIVAPRDVADVQ